ncbi:transcription initiation at TATA-containing promoter protein [Elasticomyces elasticus]|nr:transcription initiation at TATA-containing promoter protein [Elasticomyces elasticus]KAK3663131.1 transcription initiation at TATA-containing promoter protein [Elasticomyces elasticus]KAK4924027.1 transcription initiation at TATA-containing promoter protein [Elasticomyces elasticus]KAK5764384.1 transcription initiation at TATA-containing promoter protein [Elasticomyces elasticus]
MDALEINAAMWADALRIGRESYIAKLREDYGVKTAALRQKHTNELAEVEAKHEKALQDAERQPAEDPVARLHQEDAAMQYCKQIQQHEYEAQIERLQTEVQRLKRKAESVDDLRPPKQQVLMQEVTRAAQTQLQALPPTQPTSMLSEPPTAMSTATKAALVLTMNSMKRSQHARFFLCPVVIVKLRIPEYPTIIKTPMDLSTMERKLTTGHYVSIQQFVNDFGVMIGNTMEFNGPYHEVSNAGRMLQIGFECMMKEVPGAEGVIIGRRQVEQAASKQLQCNGADVRRDDSTDSVTPKEVASASSFGTRPVRATRKRYVPGDLSLEALTARIGLGLKDMDQLEKS